LNAFFSRVSISRSAALKDSAWSNVRGFARLFYTIWQFFADVQKIAKSVKNRTPQKKGFTVCIIVFHFISFHINNHDMYTNTTLFMPHIFLYIMIFNPCNLLIKMFNEKWTFCISKSNFRKDIHGTKKVAIICNLEMVCSCILHITMPATFQYYIPFPQHKLFVCWHGNRKF